VAVFLGLNVPGARAGIIPAAGLAGLAFPSFTTAMLSGSTLFYGWHVALGFLVGPSANALLEDLHLPLLPVLVGLAVLGLAGWLLLRWRRQQASGAPAASTAETLHHWADAACPACLAIAAVQRLNAPIRAAAETQA
jgi:LPXTG-motif cell wall-anchored protein